MVSALRMSELIRLDSKGRVLIPQSVREALGFREGMYLMLIADLDRGEVLLTPFADPEARLMEFRIKLTDVPGALARVANVLADANVDLLHTESRTIRRGEYAEWIAVADVSKCSVDMDVLKERILNEGKAQAVEIREYWRG